jgi:hypothetical protein
MTDVATLLNVRYDSETGRMILEFEVHDPTIKQKILRDVDNLEVKLVMEKKNAHL